MAETSSINLSIDDIDDLLYFTRINDESALQESLTNLSTQHSCSPAQIISSCTDPENGNTIIHYCSANGFSSLLSNLLKLFPTAEATASSPASSSVVLDLINRKNAQGNTPLHWAAYNGHLDIVKLLIAAGGDMWIKNSAGHLAMFEAERAEKSDVVQVLLEAGGTTVEQSGSEGVADEDVEISMSAGDTSGPGENVEMGGV